MLEYITGLLNYINLLFFGIVLSASFLSIEANKKNNILAIVSSLFMLILQYISYYMFGGAAAEMLYPITTHFPLFLLFTFVFKKKPLQSAFAITSAYLCCQISKWIGIVSYAIYPSKSLEYTVKIIITILLCIFILKFVSPSIQIVVSKSDKTILIFGILPNMYYIFDYLTSVYTKLLYSGSIVVYEFLPFILSIAYLIFGIVYFKEYEEKCEAERYRQLMEIQKTQSIKEIEALKKSEHEISILRHDMRHFLNSIAAYIDSGEYDKAGNYISRVNEKISNTVIHQFCKNNIINIILSYYQDIMTQSSIKFICSVDIPDILPCAEPEFTSILSNGLENAVKATKNNAEENRYVSLYLHETNGKLLLSIKNPYSDNPVFVDGLPVTTEKLHGFGTQSIKYVTEKLNGKFKFSAQNGVFVLQIVL